METGNTPNQDPHQQSIGILAHWLIEVVDTVPLFRSIDPEIARSLGNSLALLSIETPDQAFKYQVLAHGATPENVSTASIQALRAQGVRVGPFRKHKINRLIGG